MSKRIGISDLRKDYADKIDDLADFLSKNLDLESVIEKDSVVLNGELSRKRVRVLIKKFLHKNQMKGYRLISEGEIWQIKKRKEYQI